MVGQWKQDCDISIQSVNIFNILYLWQFFIFVFFLAHCDAVVTRPGADYALRPLERTDSGKIYSQHSAPIPVRLELLGCSDYAAVLIQQELTGTLQRELTVRQLDNTHSEVDVYAYWFLNHEEACLADDEKPFKVNFTIEIICHQDQRRLQTDVVLLVSPASRTITHSYGPVETLFAVDDEDPPSLVMLAGNRLAWLRKQVWNDTRIAFDTKEGPPLFAKYDRRAFVWAGCPFASCGTADVLANDTSFGDWVLAVAPASYIFSFEMYPGVLRPVAAPPLVVTGPARSLAIDENSDLLALGVVINMAAINRYKRNPQDVYTAQPVHLVESGYAPSAFQKNASGQFNFAGTDIYFSPDINSGEKIYINSVNGDPLTLKSPDRNQGPLGLLDLSPSGSQLLVQLGDNLWLWHADYEWRQLQIADNKLLEVDWHKDTVAITSIDKTASTIDNEFYRVSIFALLPDISDVPLSTIHLATKPLSVLNVAGNLVITTSLGISIFNQQGILLGGLDPLPCDQRITAPAIQVGNTVVVSTKDRLYQLDISRYIANHEP